MLCGVIIMEITIYIDKLPYVTNLKFTKDKEKQEKEKITEELIKALKSVKVVPNST